MALSRLRSGREADGSQQDKEDDEVGDCFEVRVLDLEQGPHDEEESNLLVTSTVSVPEVSLVPSPEVSKVTGSFVI